MTTYFSVTTTIKRPQDQRENAEHGLRRGLGRTAAGGNDGLTQRVERAGADVAVDDADAAQHQGLEGGGGMHFSMTVGRGRLRLGDRTLQMTWKKRLGGYRNAQYRTAGLYALRECIG